MPGAPAGASEHVAPAPPAQIDPAAPRAAADQPGLKLQKTEPSAEPRTGKARRPTKPTGPTDSAREVVETVVFVVVLVLLLKTFLAEAFVIPTGSMADTLLGYHKTVKCEQCDTHFLVNLSGQVDPDVGPPRPVTGAWCPNCHYYNRFPQFREAPEREERP